MVQINDLAGKIFALLKGNNLQIKIFDEAGAETTDPNMGRRFFVSKPNIMVTIDEEGNTIEFSKGSSVDDSVVSIQKGIRRLANEFLMNSDIKVFGRTIQPRDYAYQAKRQKEAAMNENTMRPVNHHLVGKIMHTIKLFGGTISESDLINNLGIVDLSEIRPVLNRLVSQGQLTAEQDKTGQAVYRKSVEEAIMEVSNELLSKYKKAASKDASKADAEGNFKKGDKRFSGIISATKKQFDNDVKKRTTNEAGVIDAIKGAWNGMKQGWNKQDSEEQQASPIKKSTGNAEVDKLLQTPEAWKLKKQGMPDEEIVDQLLKNRADSKPNQTGEDPEKKAQRAHELNMAKLRQDGEKDKRHHDTVFGGSRNKQNDIRGIKSRERQQKGSASSGNNQAAGQQNQQGGQPDFSQFTQPGRQQAGQTPPPPPGAQTPPPPPPGNSQKTSRFDTGNVTDVVPKIKVPPLLPMASGLPGIKESLSKMYGSKKTSQQTLENVKILVKHKTPVDENVRGSRSRHISAIFLECNGERFRFPNTYLPGARAMAQHMAHGGVMSDKVGSYITESTSQLLKLQSFNRYVTTNNLINEDSSGIIDTVKENIETIRTELKKLTGSKTYETIKARLETFEREPLAEDDTSNLKDLFTIRRFDEKFEEVLPIVKQLVQEKDTYYKRIEEAAANTVFLKRDVINTTPMFEFASENARLGFKISELSLRISENEELSGFINKIGTKLCKEGVVNDFERAVLTQVLENVKVEETTITKKEIKESADLSAYFDRYTQNFF